MRTLLVHYLPRGARSRTGRLVEAFRQTAGAVSFEEVDLAARPPAALDALSLPPRTCGATTAVKPCRDPSRLRWPRPTA